ncbi:MAG: response regulator [candidate division Zixibacteria bacterium]|nr:response regulator [candidate division Zixibacteria bacterium]
MSMKILVIDDSPTMRSVAESSLRQKGYEVMLADGIQKGLELMQSNKPDFILLDYSLPDIDCGAMCRRLRHEEQSKDVPLVVLLSSAELNVKGELMECGADGFIVKPFTAKELLSTIEEVSAKRSPKEQEGEMVQASEGEKLSDSDKIEFDAMLIDSSKKPKSPQKDTFEETSVSLDLGGIHGTNGPVEENVVSPDSLSDSSKIKTDSDFSLSHDYNWFVSEIKKEMKENGEEKLQPETEIISEDTSIDYMSKINLEDELKSATEKTETPTDKEFEHFLSDFKKEMEGVDIGEEGLGVAAKEEKKPKEAKPRSEEAEAVHQERLDHNELADRIVKEVSEKIAQQIASNIDRDFLKEMIEKYLKEK